MKRSGRYRNLEYYLRPFFCFCKKMVKLYVQVYKCKVKYKLIETSKTRGDCRELKLSKSPHILLIIELGKRRGKHTKQHKMFLCPASKTTCQI